jgi:hypothetical protein
MFFPAKVVFGSLEWFDNIVQKTLGRFL